MVPPPRNISPSDFSYGMVSVGPQREGLSWIAKRVSKYLIMKVSTRSAKQFSGSLESDFFGPGIVKMSISEGLNLTENLHSQVYYLFFKR